jgi:hypothetical protein
MFYPGDWQKDPNLRRATRSEKGLLMDLLCLMFESKERGVLATGGVPWADEEIVYAVGGDPSATLIELTSLVRKGVLSRRNDGALFSRRLVREEEIRQVRSEAGSLGGRPTKYQKQNGVTEKSKIKANHKANTKLITEYESESEDENEIENEFESFWKEYPRKVAKGKCRELWKRLKPCESLKNKILESVIVQRDSLAWSREEGKFIPHPSTWLLQKRWQDEPDNFGQKPSKSLAELEREMLANAAKR